MNTRLKAHPVLVDRSMNRAFSVKYMIYSLFGLVGAIATVPAIGDLSGGRGSFYETFWAFAVFVTSAVAARYAWNGNHERREMLSTMAMIGFVACYSISLIVLAFQGEGSRDALAVICTGLLVFPTWRVLFLFGKLRKPRKKIIRG